MLGLQECFPMPILNIHLLNPKDLAFHPYPGTPDTCLIEPLPYLPPCKGSGYQGQQKTRETRSRLLRWSCHTRRVWESLWEGQSSSAFTPPPMTSSPFSPICLPYSQYSSVWSKEEVEVSDLLLKCCMLLGKCLPQSGLSAADSLRGPLGSAGWTWASRLCCL